MVVATTGVHYQPMENIKWLAHIIQRVGGKLNGTNERLQEMDQLGVDVQVLSPNPGQYYYFAEDELGLSVCQIINNQIAEAIANQPRRFVGLATLPLQNVQLAIEEMRRCVRECGMRGVEVGTYVAGKELAHDDFRPFFKEAEKLDVMIFIHPLGFSHGERLSLHHLNNIVGNPIESTIALSHLIFSGVLDSYPGLKICVAHGGGYLPGYWGRMDHAFHAREDCRLHISNKPSSYLRKIWFDSVVFDKQQLQSMIETHGADKICLGTDYPFDMAEPDPVGLSLSVVVSPVWVRLSCLNSKTST